MVNDLTKKFEVEYRPVQFSFNPTKYSPMTLSSYDKERHILIEDSLSLIKNNSLSTDALNKAIVDGEISVYEFNEKKYLDRLDIGRVYHNSPSKTEGLTIPRYFTKVGEDPFNSVNFTKRNLKIQDGKTGELKFQMEDAEIPDWMNDVDAAIVANKYFFNPIKPEWKEKIRNKLGVGHEYSLKHLNKRVADFFTDEGDKLGYFKTPEDKETFRNELYYMQVNGIGAFNSPVQFNAGLFNTYKISGSAGMNYFRDPKTGEIKKVANGEYIHPQSHACFIKGPGDDLESLAQNVVDEIGIFSSGSGIGHNCDNIRANGERLSGGGKASGPLSFEMIDDRVAGSIKSGGKTRRAARMLAMGYHHPEIMEFIRIKVREDKKALALMEAGFSPGMDGEAYMTVAFQNTNLSVRLDDKFFDAVENNQNIKLYNVNDNNIAGEISADKMLKELAFGSWRDGDPSVQYESKMEEMNTCKNSGRQRSTNPCGEYSFLDDTSCNLFSHKLTAFLNSEGNFNVEKYKHSVRIAAIAQDIANHISSYPVKEIALISPEFGSVGMGYADMGSLLMRKGIPYDSEKGRAIAGAITALMTGTVYETSIELAKNLGAFTHFEFNKKPMMEVIDKHKKSLDDVLWEQVGDENLKNASYASWKNVLEEGDKYGFRNAQATCIAPTGTISFLMGCSTTGIEPAYSLDIVKNLAGGGNVHIANKDVEIALNTLGYTPDEIKDISDFVGKKNSLRNSPHLKTEHYDIFNTALGNRGEGHIDIDGHIRMVAAAQPFVSGAISKTNNLPHDATVKQIYDCYLLGHELGLKGITMFRDESKPISALGGEKSYKRLKRGEKEELPTRRNAFEWEVQLGGTQFHILTSDYNDGRPGQITFLCYKAGSTLGSAITNAGVAASKSLKRGVHLEDVIDSWGGQSFEPNGLVGGHPYIKTAGSIFDLAHKILRLEYLGDKEMAEPTLKDKINLQELRGFKNGAFRTYERMKVDEWNIEDVLKDSETGGFVEKKGIIFQNGEQNGNKNVRGKVCDHCGNIMHQSGPNCFECKTCGDKIGGCGA